MANTGRIPLWLVGGYNKIGAATTTQKGASSAASCPCWSGLTGHGHGEVELSLSTTRPGESLKETPVWEGWVGTNQKKGLSCQAAGPATGARRRRVDGISQEEAAACAGHLMDALSDDAYAAHDVFGEWLNFDKIDMSVGSALSCPCWSVAAAADGDALFLRRGYDAVGNVGYPDEVRLTCQSAGDGGVVRSLTTAMMQDCAAGFFAMPDGDLIFSAKVWN